MSKLFAVICFVGYLIFLVRIYQWANETIENDKANRSEQLDTPEDQGFFQGAASYGIRIP